jgi:hypothetical protein
VVTVLGLERQNKDESSAAATSGLAALSTTDESVLKQSAVLKTEKMPLV